MIILKSLVFYPDFSGCEATWVNQIHTPDIEHAAVDAMLDEKGVEISPAVDAYTEVGATIETQVKCHSYHPTQIEMLRADAFTFGTPLEQYEEQLSAIESAHFPPDPEPVLVPQVITIRQAKLVLLAAGLLDDVDAAVSAADRTTQIEWEYATEVKRDWPTLMAMQASLGLSDSQIDQLFIQGALL